MHESQTKSSIRGLLRSQYHNLRMQYYIIRQQGSKMSLCLASDVTLETGEMRRQRTDPSQSFLMQMGGRRKGGVLRAEPLKSVSPYLPPHPRSRTAPWASVEKTTSLPFSIHVELTSRPVSGDGAVTSLWQLQNHSFC